MTPSTPCPRERDVLDLAALGQWPSRADAELEAHARECATCRDLAVVAAAIAVLRDEPIGPARVPDPALVWYRAQVRAREELRRRADRPVLIAQGTAAVAAVGLGVVAWQVGSPLVASWWNLLGDAYSGWSASVPTLEWIPSSGLAIWALIGIGIWAALIAAGFSVAALADRVADSQAERR